MNSLLTSQFINEKIAELTSENKNRFEMLSDFAQTAESEGKNILILTEENGRKILRTTDCVGFVRFADGTQLEILPHISKECENEFYEARKLLCRSLCELFDIVYPDNAIDNSESFFECFISVFVKESMKIIKSGMLHGYKSVEENLNMVQGNIMFAENSRKNLIHQERVYVRHDVFTSDRAENRLIKATAKLMMKLSVNSQSSRSLKQILSFLEEVKTPVSYKEEFSKCINTRNTKKYNTVLNICRMVLNNRDGENFGSYVSYAMFFKEREVISSYKS